MKRLTKSDKREIGGARLKGNLLELPKVAVVGCGNWGKNLVRNFAQLGALAAVCDSDSGRLENAAKEYRGAEDNQ